MKRATLEKVHAATEANAVAFLINDAAGTARLVIEWESPDQNTWIEHVAQSAGDMLGRDGIGHVDITWSFQEANND